jgi:hypothetical protein
MEKRLNKKIELYITRFKDDIKNKIQSLNISETNKLNDIIEYLYDYERLQIIQDDLSKRKRIKNTIPVTNRCSAKRANNEQCTRRRKEGSEFCGTHVKGVPHGLILDTTNSKIENKEVIATEIMGIIYYIDNDNNVYNTEDIMNNIKNPRIIAKCENNSGIITIPELGLI